MKSDSIMKTTDFVLEDIAEEDNEGKQAASSMEANAIRYNTLPKTNDIEMMETPEVTISKDLQECKVETSTSNAKESESRAPLNAWDEKKRVRKDTISNISTITPISIQRELLLYRNSSVWAEDLREQLMKWWSVGYLKVFLLWTTWMVTGTLFYAIREEMGWAKGFYMMVNVGYSIGWYM